MKNVPKAPLQTVKRIIEIPYNFLAIELRSYDIGAHASERTKAIDRLEYLFYTIDVDAALLTARHVDERWLTPTSP
jgi:hypothetical protein